MDVSSKPRNGSDTILYGWDGSKESAAMAELLRELGVQFEYRSVSRDLAARKEWEDLDGERLPILRVGANHIVRGLDQIRVRQIVGWVGC